LSIITLTNVVKQYQQHTALDHLNLHVDRGIILGLLGPNGAGKTTLIAILNGLTDFQEGEITVFDQPLTRNLHAIRRRCSFIPQALALYGDLTVLENLTFFAKIQNIQGNKLQKSLEYAIAVNRLGPMLSQKAATLSGGQQRRLNIAIGLLNDPEILYLDEPTAGIDPALRNDILSSVSSLKKDGKTIIYTSHYMEEVEKICDQVAIISHGKIIHQEVMAKLLNRGLNNGVHIKLAPTDLQQLKACVTRHDNVTILDATTLFMADTSAEKTGHLLQTLENNAMAVRSINYGTTSLESLFIRLTSAEKKHV